MWYRWFSTHVLYCKCAHEVQSSILDAALFFILYNNNNSDKLDSLYLEIPTRLLLDSYWTPTGLLLDSLYWSPTGVLLESLYWTPVYPFLSNPQFLVIPVGIY